MPSWFVSEPFLNLWVQDVPLAYTPAYGPAVELRLAYHDRVQGSLFTGNLWHGAQFGNDGGLHGLWSASWLSFAELDSAESKVDLMLPAGGWATFTFPANSAVSDVNYLHNLTLEKLGPSGGITNLTLHYTDGSSAIYDVADKSDTSYAGLFYVSKSLDPAGNKTSFAYDGNFFLTNVTAADGASFALQLDQTFLQPLVTNVTASYGASCSFSYGGTSYDPQVLVAIQDAGGISSLFDYEAPAGGLLTKLTTPYGTTFLSTLGDGGFYGIFDRTVRITNANDTQEFYGQINGYAGTDWPDFASGQIPTNTPLATLDTTERQERNTFYWNAQQFVPFVNTSLYDFDWAALKRSRIRHWLAKTEPNYTHFGSLSLQQEPSPDGTTEGQLTWYDYAGKPANVNYEPGTQIMPSVVARAMPDGGTAYQYFEYNSIGNATNMIEKWVEGIAAQFRTNHYVYAANGVDLLAWTNALGVRASSNVFNAHHQILTNYDALNQMTTYTYDNTTLQLTGAAHPSGLTTTYTYDANHRLQEASDSPISRTRDFTWYDSGDLKTLTDERGMVATNYWDGLHRLTGTSDSRGATTNLYERATAYPNSTGGTKILDVTATKDRLGNWTYFDYDPLRRLTAVTNANNVVTRYGYCDCGAVAYITNAWGTPVEEATVFGYDYQGNRIYTLNADGYNVTNSYDALRQLIATSDAVGGRSFFYNNLGLLTNVSNAYGAEQTTVYDLGDRAAYVSDANGVTITNTYDDLGRLRTRGYPDGGVEKFGYSARDLIAYTNQLGFTNAFGYDEAGRKIAETNANAEVLRYTYNAAGDLLTLVDGKSQTTTWHYDQFGRVTNKLNQAGVEILRYKYDADSRLTNRWSKAKGDTYYTYDAAGNLTLVDYPSSPDIAFRYDWLDRLTNMVDAAGTNKYTYTAGNRVLTDDGPFASDTVTNTYQNRLRTKLVLQQPTGSWTNALVYDAARRLTNVASPAGTSGYTLGATAPGSPLPRRLALPNTALITNTYDTVARLLGGYLKNSGGSVLDSYVYNYNAANQRTSLTRVDASTVDYRYDNLGQLTVADSSVNSEDRGYYYDAASSLNRLTNNGAVAAFTVDNQNQLTADPTCFQDDYDDNGNLRVRWVNIEGSVVRLFEYVYDDENRLITAIGYTNVEVGCAVWEDAPLWQTDLTYDGLGRLRLRTESGVTGPEPDSWAPLSTTEYIYDGMRVIQERDGGNTPQVSYTRGTDLSGSFEGAGGIGGLLARSEYNGSGGWTNHAYYFADANGNVTYMIDSSQTMVASYRYDPFGNTISKSGSLADANVYRFSSKEIHVNSGMYYYGYRFYDPNLQRWINRDPAFDLGWSILTREQPRESRVNLYRFVANTPLSAIDPLGLKIWVCTRGAFGGAVGRHSYIWDDRDLPNRYDPKKPWQRSCGQENISGSASSGSGTNTEGDNGPMPGFEGGVYHGPGDATCYPVQNSDGKEEGVRRCCENPREINAGMWFPFINDCHNRMNHCLEQGGIFPYEIPNHPRFGGGNYPPGYKY
jgi:RHS repeat-associated protein